MKNILAVITWVLFGMASVASQAGEVRVLSPSAITSPAAKAILVANGVQ